MRCLYSQLLILEKKPIINHCSFAVYLQFLNFFVILKCELFISNKSICLVRLDPYICTNMLNDATKFKKILFSLAIFASVCHWITAISKLQIPLRV